MQNKWISLPLQKTECEWLAQIIGQSPKHSYQNFPGSVVLQVYLM